MGQRYAGRDAALSGRSGMAGEDDSRFPSADQTRIRPHPRSLAQSGKCNDDAHRARGGRSQGRVETDPACRQHSQAVGAFANPNFRQVGAGSRREPEPLRTFVCDPKSVLRVTRVQTRISRLGESFPSVLGQAWNASPRPRSTLDSSFVMCELRGGTLVEQVWHPRAIFKFFASSYIPD